METEGYRSAELTLELASDITPADLILHSPLQMNTTASSVTIAGEVHDSGSGVQSVMVTSDQYSLNFPGFFSNSHNGVGPR
jgi:hypothetical protein